MTEKKKIKKIIHHDVNELVYYWTEKKWCCVKWIWREELRQQSFYNAVDVSFKQKMIYNKNIKSNFPPMRQQKWFFDEKHIKITTSI